MSDTPPFERADGANVYNWPEVLERKDKQIAELEAEIERLKGEVESKLSTQNQKPLWMIEGEDDDR